MGDLPLAKEPDRVADLGIFDEAQDIVIGAAGLLLRGHILIEVGDWIALGLELAGVEGNPSGGLGPDARAVIHVIISEALFLQLLGGKAAGELMDNGGDDLQVGQLLRAYRSNGNVPYPEKR